MVCGGDSLRRMGLLAARLRRSSMPASMLPFLRFEVIVEPNGGAIRVSATGPGRARRTSWGLGQRGATSLLVFEHAYQSS